MTDKKSFVEQIKGLPTNFWYACTMELFERLAFFAVRAIAPLYLVKMSNEHGLALSYTDKGSIYMVWALIQCLLPMVSGGYTDRYGYRKSLAIAFVINIIGYLMMALSFPISSSLTASGFGSANYWVFMVAACFVATGTAIFKPAAQGTIAKSVNDETSSMGWGTFYWVVNLGGAFAPMIAAPLRGEIAWENVFYFAAVVTLLNFIPAFLFYKEPSKERNDAGETSTPTYSDDQVGPLQVFVSSIKTVLQDKRLVLFLLIFSCFWLMFMQLWDLLPNFIDEWVDTSDVAPIFGWFNSGWVAASGQTKPEMIININPISILLLVLFVSWLIRRMNKIAAMIIGMFISLVGFTAAGATSVGWFCCLMLLIFSVGEMTCSPTFQAYVGLIAPPDKKALYMGYANIPFAIGWALGNSIGGVLYENLGSKVNLAREYMIEHLGMNADTVKAIENQHVLDALAKALGGETSLAMMEVTQKLWDTYRPDIVWYYLGSIGLLGTIGMLIFYFMTKPTNNAV